MKSKSLTAHRRRGISLPLIAVLLVVLIGLLAFAVDLGYISLVRGQMQSAADAAALASASQLLDRAWLAGNTSQSLDDADAQANRFASANRAGGVALTLGTGDVVYGYIENPQDPNAAIDAGRTPYNAATVKVQRTNARNGELGLFFARIFNRNSLPLQTSATATYEGNIRGFQFNPNDPNQKSLLLPFSLSESIWDSALDDLTGTDDWSYDPESEIGAVGEGDGIREVTLYPTKNMAPGNFGTVDIGSSDNSSSVIERQILDGPNRADFDLMGGKVALGEDNTLTLTGDTGISAGFKDALRTIAGQPRIIPLHNAVQGTGDNARFTIVRFVGCVILDVQLTGGAKAIVIQPEFVTDSTAIGGGPESSKSFVFKPLKLTR